MAHPSRSVFVSELLAALDRDATVVWDRRGDRWDTGRRAWEAIDRSATHGLVLQDDTIPCRDLAAGVEAALASLPDPARSPLCLYCGRVRPYKEQISALVAAATDSTSWLTMTQLHWGPGIVMPAHLIPDMIAWCDQRTEIPNYDRRISRWIQQQGLTVWYPWPSLVEHRGVDENPSLISGRTGDRRAYQFLGAGRSALELSWDGIVVSVPAPANHRHASAPSPAVTGRSRPRLGAAVKFVSTKYPQLQVPGARVRFRDGEASTTDAVAVEMLTSPQLRAMGVEPVGDVPPASTDESASGPPPQVEAVGSEPADNAAKEVDVAEGGDAEPDQPDAAAPPEPAAQEPGGLPNGGAKDVMAWVNADPERTAERAAEALRVEQAREKPRTTLVATLTKLAG